MQKTVNLILSGGGARGYVHIGVIEVLLESNSNKFNKKQRNLVSRRKFI
jgi:predicted acylesterase/phospholipase RssA